MRAILGTAFVLSSSSTSRSTSPCCTGERRGLNPVFTFSGYLTTPTMAAHPAHTARRLPPLARIDPRNRAGGERRSMRIAAIDVGSNSIHMIVAAGRRRRRRHDAVADEGDGRPRARISFPSRRLSQRRDGPRDRRRSAASSRRRQQRQCEKIVAVATSAVREATNGGDFIERVKRELGLDVRVVSGRDEARLIYLGVRHAMRPARTSRT